MLQECLQSLLNQRTNGAFTFEVVVIDNNSKDNTAEVVASLQANAPVPLRYVFEPNPGQVHARHRGFDEARGEWIANFDDDEIAEPDWCLAMLELARAKNIRSVGGALWLRLPEDCTRQLHPRVRRVLGESVNWKEPQPYTRRQGPGSGTQLLHKSIFQEIGRYDLSLSLRGYDNDFYRRMRAAGIESWYAPNSIAFHVTPPERLTYRYLQETCFHDGWTFARRDIDHFGTLLCFGVVILRMINALARHLPVWLLSKLKRDEESALAHWLMLVRQEGYTRCYLKQTFPKWFPQTATLQRYRIVPTPSKTPTSASSS